MDINKSIKCPKCNGSNFLAKYEATYVYSYNIDTADISSKKETLPFLFDNREQCNTKQYIECQDCKEKYPCSFKQGEGEIDFTIIKKAIRAPHKETPEFLG
ncbi:hypothetical protein [Dethiothermospora halolimnae]|uniref:hypothetical protein n=1 Tax=Dethiothermospora halolimnae TaxID=3114390 RepID=UPI003CCBBEAB